MRPVCVVLAGGLSRRFAGDKLKAPLGGQPVLRRVLDAARKAGAEVRLSVATAEQGEALLESAGTEIPVVTDLAGTGLAGPPLAIFSALSKVEREEVLFLPGDVPWIEAEALSAFVGRCEAAGCDVGTVYWPSGAVEILTQFHKRERSLPALIRATRARGRLMRASDVLRAAGSTMYVDAGAVTRDPLCFANANTSADLQDPKPRGVITTGRGTDLQVSGEAKKMYLRGLESQERGDHARAAEALEAEAGVYERLGIGQVAMHCLQDHVHFAELAGLSAERGRRRISGLRAHFEPVGAARQETS